MKTSSVELNKIMDQLNEIFESPDFRYTNKVGEKLEKLGFEVKQVKGNHPKLYFNLNDKKHCVVMCCSPSKTFTGKEILREIRRIYESEN